MPTPTRQQLEKINSFAITPLRQDNCYVFRPLMIDNQETAYFSILHDNLLKTFMADTQKGIALLMNHRSYQLPVGRSFEAELRYEYDEEIGVNCFSLYGDFYIDLGRRTESGMSTDDIAKGVDAGTIFAVSIGFNADSWKCTICNNDIRDWRLCEHIPGQSYVVERDGRLVEEVCKVIVGEDGKGNIRELSLVYDGACDRAVIKQVFSTEGVTDFNKGTKLTKVTSFKNIPLDATVYCMYSGGELAVYTDVQGVTDDVGVSQQRSEEELSITQLKEVFGQLGFDFDSGEQLFEAIVNSNNEKDAEINRLREEVHAVVDELEKTKTELRQQDELLDKICSIEQELDKVNSVVETYRSDLINQALEAGVRAQGNVFKAELFSKFLSGLSIEAIKEILVELENETELRFSGTRVTEVTKKGSVEPTHKDEFESEADFRAFVAQKAVDYAKENSVSLAEATKFIYGKFSSK